MTEKSFSGAEFKPYIALCPSCKEPFMKDQPWKLQCVTCYLVRKGRTAPTASYPVTPAIEPDMLRRLIYLVHPDKHGNSEAANTATRYLLALKGALHG